MPVTEEEVEAARAKKTLNEVLDFFAAHNTNPGDWWGFTDDGSEFCLDYRSPNGARFWLDLTREGVISLLWRAPGSTEHQSFAFEAASKVRESS